MQNILFRADSSSSIGIGHVMRALVLATQYKDSNIIFATQELDGNINDRIRKSSYKVELLKSNEIEELIKLVKKNYIDMVVIDHYNIDYKFEKKLKKQTGVKILSFDDTYVRHCCDILLNHNINADKTKYASLVPKNCEIRCGKKYTLLRDEFINIDLRKRSIENSEVITFFVAMGGADSQSMNISILEKLLNFSCIINLVTTSANENLKLLKEFIRNKENINLHIDAINIAVLVNNSDIAVVTPSVIVNEISFLKIPFIAILVAENQREMLNYLNSKQLFTLEKENLQELEIYIKTLTNKNVYNEQIEILTGL